MRRWLAVLISVIAVSISQGMAVTVAHATTHESTGWLIQPSPNPAGATNSALYGIDCLSSRQCLAVGYYSSGNRGYRTLAERWDGTDWTIAKTPNVAPGPNDDSELLSVSCAGPTQCIAVGYSVVSDNGHIVVRAMIEQWNGTKWRLMRAPVVSGASWVSLASVSCPTSISCTAVGGSIGKGLNSEEKPLAEVWNGTAWNIETTPNPRAENGSWLSSVSCTATTACTAGGNYAYADVAQSIFAFRWNGKSWSQQNQPNPNGQDDNSTNDVSCFDETACSSVGTWVNGANKTVTLAEHWNGADWGLQRTLEPQGADITDLYGVSCFGASSCDAVGDSSSDFNGYLSTVLAEHWNGTTWRIQPAPDPVGAQASELNDVSCASTNECIAVGSTSNGTVNVTLIEARSSRSG